MTLHRLDAVPGSAADAAQTAALAHRLGAGWAVEDGYQFDVAYQRALKEAGLRLLAIDDYGHAGHYVADLVLNQNIYAHESYYPSREPYTRLLLGTQYVLLRREFLRWRGWQREIPDVARKVLVTMGGGDPDNVTLKVLEALAQTLVSRLEVVVAAGAGNPHLPALCTAVQQSPHTVRLEQNVTDMAELMAWADVGVSAGGSTCWELAFMGTPALLVSVADNQIAVAAGLAHAGAAIDLGWHTSLTISDLAGALTGLLLFPDSRYTISQRAKDLVDGHGANRATRYLKPEAMTLRPVQQEDSHLIWEWANDPVTRSQSFSSDPIPWKRHQTWFEERLSDPLTHFYLAMGESARAIGQIRFQIDGETATVSVSLAPEQRGKGYGAQLIGSGSRQIWLATQVMEIHAYIKPDNLASIRAFSQAGYESNGAMTVQDHAALRFRLRRTQADANDA